MLFFVVFVKYEPNKRCYRTRIRHGINAHERSQARRRKQVARIDSEWTKLDYDFKLPLIKVHGLHGKI